jgi:hypothetical protein
VTETSKVYCRSCGALAAANADWCGQCYTPLVERRSKGVAPRWAETAEEAPPRPDMPALQPNGKAPGGAVAVPAAPTNGHAEARRPTWPCAACQSENDLDLQSCAVCGTPFGRLFEEPKLRPSVDPRSAVVRSLVFPGLGHVHTGRGGDGLARAILFLWTFGTAALLLMSRSGATASALLTVGLMYLAAATVLYVITAVDARRAALGDPPILSPKALLFGTVGMIVLSIGSLFTLVTKAAH